MAYLSSCFRSLFFGSAVCSEEVKEEVEFKFKLLEERRRKRDDHSSISAPAHGDVLLRRKLLELLLCIELVRLIIVVAISVSWEVSFIMSALIYVDAGRFLPN